MSIDLTSKFNNNGYVDVSGTFNLFDLEEDVIKKVNIFYIQYAKTLRCTSNNSTIVPSDCGSADTLEKTTAEAYNNAKKAIDIYNTALESVDKTGIDKNEYVSNYDYLLTQYKSTLKTRSQLDAKLRDIMKTDDSKFAMFQAQYDSIVYSSVLWTILATTLIYYTFIKL